MKNYFITLITLLFLISLASAFYIDPLDERYKGLLFPNALQNITQNNNGSGGDSNGVTWTELNTYLIPLKDVNNLGVDHVSAGTNISLSCTGNDGNGTCTINSTGSGTGEVSYLQFKQFFDGNLALMRPIADANITSVSLSKIIFDNNGNLNYGWLSTANPNLALPTLLAQSGKCLSNNGSVLNWTACGSGSGGFYFAGANLILSDGNVFYVNDNNLALTFYKQTDANNVFIKIVDTNNVGRVFYTTIADFNSHVQQLLSVGRTYTSGTPSTIQVNNDTNTISQNFDGNFYSRLNSHVPWADANIASAATWNAKLGGSGTITFIPKWNTNSTLNDSNLLQTSEAIEYFDENTVIALHRNESGDETYIVFGAKPINDSTIQATSNSFVSRITNASNGFTIDYNNTPSIGQVTPLITGLSMDPTGIFNIQSSKIQFAAGDVYTMPPSNASGCLENDGSGNISWSSTCLTGGTSLDTNTFTAGIQAKDTNNFNIDLNTTGLRVGTSFNGATQFQIGIPNKNPNMIYLDSSNQRIGIGKSTASFALDVNGTLGVSTGISNSSNYSGNGTMSIATSVLVLSSSPFGTRGSAASNARFNVFGGTSSAGAANSSLLSSAIAGGTITEGTSGTHPLVATMALQPVTITNGSAVTTDVATLYIIGSSTTNLSTNRPYALWVDQNTLDSNSEVISRIDQNLGINMRPNGYNLDVNGSTRSNSLVYMTGITNSAQTNALCWNATTGEVTENSGATTCLASSIRYKENIIALTDSGLEIVEKMQPVQYNLKADASKKKQVGFIAEEVAKVDERLVARGEDGTINGMNYEQYTAILTKAIQEQQVEIEELKAQVKKLKEGKK